MSYDQRLLNLISLHHISIALSLSDNKPRIICDLFFMGIKAEVDAAATIIGYLKLTGCPFTISTNISEAAEWVTSYQRNYAIGLFGISPFTHGHRLTQQIDIDLDVSEWWLTGSGIQIVNLPASYSVAICNLPLATEVPLGSVGSVVTAWAWQPQTSMASKAERDQLWNESRVAADLVKSKLEDYMKRLQEKLKKREN
ncbi:hypothetical protein EW146_g5795 [Bondarzewia mesenterica]|uniref:Uncharacterized protein n=1 Tax=Bondarzewia mesenterica TaxID=1095465 RepID=A0A4S4LQD2_9AGAM|nr:hypothetical protein EW146_g5795 [Bondarzewia mesenterica]